MNGQPWKDTITMTCSQCGRDVPLLPTEDARLCPYCGQGKIVRPDQNAPGILPTSRPGRGDDRPGRTQRRDVNGG